jgi:hypothetical protein
MRLALLLAVATIGLGGCTSLAQEELAVRDDGIDREKMGVVEQQAQRTGARVFWVNPPRKSSQ